MKEIQEKINMLQGYAEVLDCLESKIKWYQHVKTDENGENMVDSDGNYIYEDDEYESSKYALKALRETMKAVKKLAGI